MLDEVLSWLADKGIDFAALGIAAWSAWRGYRSEKKAEESGRKAEESERKSEENMAELQRVKEDHIASNSYGQVKVVERLLEDALAELAVVTGKDSVASKDEKRRAFLTAHNRYTDLYNEINSFCTLINNGSIKAENYINNTALQKLIDHADIQWKYFNLLNEIAEKNGLKKLNKPRYEAFKGYDEFLKNHFRNDIRWNQLQDNRRKAGLI